MSALFAGGLEFRESAMLTWYGSSSIAERGFCAGCGSTLFWRIKGDANVAVSVHAFDRNAFSMIREHIFFDDKLHWYDFADDAPRRTGAEIIAEFKASTHD